MVTTSNKGALRKDEILNAARKRLLTLGYAGLSVRDVAKTVGISIGNLQYYFPTKEDLVASVIEAEFESNLLTLSDVDWSEEDIDTSVFNVVSKLLYHFSGAAGQLYLITGFLALTDTKFQTLLSSGYGATFNSVGDALTQLAAKRSKNDQPELTSVIVALFDGAVLQLQSIQAGNRRAEIDRMCARISSAIITLIEAD